MPMRMGRRALSLRPVRSVKEIVDGVFLNVAAGVTTDFAVVQSVNDYTGGIGTCPIGAHVKSIYIEASYNGPTGGQARMDWFIGKSPGNNLTLPIPGATGGDDNRKWIFHESKGMMPSEEGGIAKKSGWIRVPPKMQRMGEDDRILIRIGASSVYSWCGKTIYKWYA